MLGLMKSGKLCKNVIGQKGSELSVVTEGNSKICSFTFPWEFLSLEIRKHLFFGNKNAPFPRGRERAPFT